MQPSIFKPSTKSETVAVYDLLEKSVVRGNALSHYKAGLFYIEQYYTAKLNNQPYIYQLFIRAQEHLFEALNKDMAAAAFALGSLYESKARNLEDVLSQSVNKGQRVLYDSYLSSTKMIYYKGAACNPQHYTESKQTHFIEACKQCIERINTNPTKAAALQPA